MCLCPFHSNINTPSFAVNKTKSGICICFNDSCGYTGNIVTLICHLSKRTKGEAYRFIEKRRNGDISETLREEILTAKEFEFVEWDSQILEKLQNQLWSDVGIPGLEYLNGRGLNNDTLRKFGVGYSSKKKMVVTPLHSPKGLLVGIIGRSIKGKVFDNSKNLPRKHTLFNLHRAKQYGDIVIVVESNFDAMLIDQAGYPNVVATLGSNLSSENFALLDRYFSTIILLTDFDDKIYFDRKNKKCRRCVSECVGHRPGRDLGNSIVNALRHKNILWGVYDKAQIFPPGCKDVGDMTKDQIRQCIQNAMGEYEYHLRFDDIL